MKKIFKTAALTAGLTIGLMSSAFAHDYKVGDLMIENPVARATPANAPVSAGYMTISNMGSEADRLVSASVNFAGETEIHEMTMDGDVMKMRELVGGIEIPAGKKITLQPGGLHVMFMKMQEPLKEGETRKATLTFEKAGMLEIEFNIETLAQIRESLSGDDMKMDHSGHAHGDNQKAE